MRLTLILTAAFATLRSVTTENVCPKENQPTADSLLSQYPVQHLKVYERKVPGFTPYNPTIQLSGKAKRFMDELPVRYEGLNSCFSTSPSLPTTRVITYSDDVGEFLKSPIKDSDCDILIADARRNIKEVGQNKDAVCKCSDGPFVRFAKYPLQIFSFSFASGLGIPDPVFGVREILLLMMCLPEHQNNMNAIIPNCFKGTFSPNEFEFIFFDLLNNMNIIKTILSPSFTEGNNNPPMIVSHYSERLKQPTERSKIVHTNKLKINGEEFDLCLAKEFRNITGFSPPSVDFMTISDLNKGVKEVHVAIVGSTIDDEDKSLLT